MLNDPPRPSSISTASSRDSLRSADFPKANFGAPLAGSLMPYIDKELATARARKSGRSGRDQQDTRQWPADQVIPIDGLCVRIGAMRCHSQALTIKLNRMCRCDEIEGMIRRSANEPG
jgi:aspartate-semialdehyde dehydrogenase